MIDVLIIFAAAFIAVLGGIAVAAWLVEKAFDDLD